MAQDFGLSFDLVINHASSRSGYFKAFLKDQPPFQDFFITGDPEADTSAVVRPRTSPLLHCYGSKAGPRWCWTTFSSDQIDLNYQKPAVLLEMLDVLLFYVANGARMIAPDLLAGMSYTPEELGAAVDAEERPVYEAVEQDVAAAAEQFGNLTPEYFGEVRRLSIRYWLTLDRREIFDEAAPSGP